MILMKRVRAFPLDYLTTSLLYFLMPFLFRWRKIPLNYEWMSFFLPYWVSVSLYSIFAAVIFHLIQNGIGPTFRVAFAPIIKKTPRILILIALIIESLWLLGFLKALVILVDLLGVISYFIHLSNRRQSLIKGSLRILVPALYFSAGFVLISSYNVLVGSIRYFASYDHFFDSIDALLMLGWNVSKISQILLRNAPPLVFELLEKLYFFMFPQIGAAIILLAFHSGVRQAMRLVGTIAIAYQLATLIYYFVPSLGPFYLSHPVAAGLPSTLATTQIQVDLVHKLELLWQTGTKDSIGLDFYIAFPCMHIAQPLIVLWFLRSMKRIFWTLALYDFAMLFAIILLQWHYVVDLFGGAMISLVAITVHRYQSKNVLAGAPVSSLSDEVLKAVS
jgi:hypothetical protein